MSNYQTPTTDSAMNAGKTGALRGVPLAGGEAIGRAVLGRGIGTALAGIAVAAAASDTDTRDEMALLAVHQGINELTGGA